MLRASPGAVRTLRSQPALRRLLNTPPAPRYQPHRHPRAPTPAPAGRTRPPNFLGPLRSSRVMPFIIDDDDDDAALMAMMEEPQSQQKPSQNSQGRASAEVGRCSHPHLKLQYVPSLTPAPANLERAAFELCSHCQLAPLCRGTQRRIPAVPEFAGFTGPRVGHRLWRRISTDGQPAPQRRRLPATRHEQHHQQRYGTGSPSTSKHHRVPRIWLLI